MCVHLLASVVLFKFNLLPSACCFLRVHTLSVAARVRRRERNSSVLPGRAREHQGKQATAGSTSNSSRVPSADAYPSKLAIIKSREYSVILSEETDARRVPGRASGKRKAKAKDAHPYRARRDGRRLVERRKGNLEAR